MSFAAVAIAAFALLFVPIIADTYSSSYNISMELTFNVSGMNYNAYADGQALNATYNSSNISQYYSCFNNSQNFTTGIVFTGSNFGYIDLVNKTDNYTVRLSQQVSGNGFVIPITQGGCDAIDAKLNASPSYINGPFKSFLPEDAYMFSMFLRYPGVDIVNASSSEIIRGRFVVQKNETGNVTQIIILGR